MRAGSLRRCRRLGSRTDGGLRPVMILGPVESIGRGDRYAAVRQTGDWRGAGRMDFGDISVSLQVVTVVVGAVGVRLYLSPR